MRNITQNLVFGLFILIALSACSEKGKITGTEAPKSEVSTSAKGDSAEAADMKETKEALDAVKK